MKTIAKICKYCTKKFEAPQKEVNRGKGDFCSLSCASRYNGRKRVVDREIIVCANPSCENIIHILKSKIKAKEKRNKTSYIFCSRQCKDQAQRIVGGLTDIQPSHYKNGLHGYRDALFRNYMILGRAIKCEICGYDKYSQVLEVHHIDKNRSNNNILNLQLLCANCHREQHI